MQVSMINGTKVTQIELLVCVFLGQTVTFQRIFGMILVGSGTLILQKIFGKKNTHPLFNLLD